MVSMIPFLQPLWNLDRNNTIELAPLQALRTGDFYLLWFAVCFSVVPITTVSSLYKVVGMTYISDDRFLANVAMAASLCNAGGRVVWGATCDRVSFKIAGSMFASVVNNLPILGGGPKYAFGMSALMGVIALLIVLWIVDRKVPHACRFLNWPMRFRARTCCPGCSHCCRQQELEFQHENSVAA
ncbi:uncharacterized protein DEA37_0010142 [Paragonimus westermani]|uniref:Uncharacterized protein n=1 Tax=Paragonimus westermani TaxID=34504 RepID=A0A5J4P2L4_9TREM|nr:uncharacterized protein DEA37_0010142 [Paragonimus westermani]